MREQVLDAIALRTVDLGPPFEPRKANVVATYDYHDESGVLLYTKRRYDPKGFSIKRLTGDRWVLYRLPRVLSADDWVFVVEGEKAVIALEKVGLVATCSPKGAGSWGNSYTEGLIGKHVCILPDNDDPGIAHAFNVFRALAPAAASVQVLDLPGLPPKGDAYDYLANGGTADELVRLAWAAGERLSRKILSHRRTPT
jgi:hypothetical protein